MKSLACRFRSGEYLKYAGIVDKDKFLKSLSDAGIKGVGSEEKFKELLTSLFEPNLEDAFRYHETKLDYLSNLLRYLRIVVPINKKYVNSMSLLQNIMGSYVKLDDSKLWTPEKLNEFLDKFNVERLDQLKARREEAFYVNIKSSALVMPSISFFDMQSMQDLMKLLIGTLLVELNTFMIFDDVSSIKKVELDKWKQEGRLAEHELCTCGHLRSEHIDLVTPDGRSFKIPFEQPEGHGECKKCKCPQFTWKGWIR